MDSPFSLDSILPYEKWRDAKLVDYPTQVENLITEIENPQQLSARESLSLRQACAKTNFAIYECKRPLRRTDVKLLGRQLGLVRLDHNLCADETGISALSVEPDMDASRYIPYTNQLLNWHSDGYYNPAEFRIRGFILHCVSAAASGGETWLLDHEIAYLLLRDKNPEFIRALMHPRAMTIPANCNNTTTIREACSGPVFSVSNNTDLEVRYTARTRSIHWRNNAILSQAREALTQVIENQQFVFKHKLQPNQGVICNNILHARTAFEDTAEQSRLIYRARYYDRVQ
jgi:hypothetical protein